MSATKHVLTNSMLTCQKYHATINPPQLLRLLARLNVKESGNLSVYVAWVEFRKYLDRVTFCFILFNHSFIVRIFTCMSG
jgi:hypothetical protein